MEKMMFKPVIDPKEIKVPTAKKTFPVLHMSCASCASSVQSMLNVQKGVVNASVNFAASNVLVEYIPGDVDFLALRTAIQSIGFDLLIEEKEKTAERLEDLQQKNTEALKNRTIGAILLSLPVFLIGMFFMDLPYANYIMWIFSTPVVVWLGRSFFINAWKQARHRKANMDTLVAVSTGIAYLFSVFNTLFPEVWHQRGLHAHVYFEAAAVVISFILLGRLLEYRAKGSTASALKKLMGLQPKTVTVENADGSLVQKDIAMVKPGEIILVKPGEKIALDGTVIIGSSYVDESMLSGEPVPVEKKTGEKVYAGTLNQKGSFRFKTEKVGAETLLSQIIQMVQEAQGSKAPVQKLVDKIAGVFVPVVMLIALVAFLLWWLLGGENGLTHGIMAFVTVLVIACPCALGLATPTALMVGVGKAAEEGILIKDAEGLELANKIDTIVFDKTGTITEGKPMVNEVLWLANHQNEQNEAILAALEQHSEHPLADAIVLHFNNVQKLKIEHFQSITGMGVKAKYQGETYFAGNTALMETNQIACNELFRKKAEEMAQNAATVIWFANKQEALAIVGISDQIKSTSAQAIATMKKMGLQIYMLTGDNQSTAESVAKQVGIEHFKAGMLPHQKADFVKQLRTTGKTVAMVGDGINDSTALALADVSIAMGKGSDIAMDVAKMTIISSDLNKIPLAIQRSKQTVKTIKQNLFWAFIYNVIGIPVAAGILFPFTGFLLNPMLAGAAMALSSVSVVSNSLRLKLKK